MHNARHQTERETGHCRIIIIIIINIIFIINITRYGNRMINFPRLTKLRRPEATIRKIAPCCVHTRHIRGARQSGSERYKQDIADGPITYGMHRNQCTKMSSVYPHVIFLCQIRRYDQ